MTCNCEGMAVVQVQIAGIQGAQGERGEPGENGHDGITPEISAEALTLPAGSQATVTQTGTKENLHLSFGIPQGQKGEKGEKGESGVVAPIDSSLIDNLF